MTHTAEYDFSPQVQTQILALLIRDPDFYGTHLQLVKPEYFSDDVNVVIARIYLDKQDGTYTFDIHTLYDTIKRELAPSEKELRPQIAQRLKRIYTLQLHKKIVEEKIIEFARHQAVTGAVLESVTLLKQHKYDQVAQKIKDATLVGKVTNDIGMDLFSVSPKQVLKRLHLARIKTGYPSVDNVLGGGLGCGELGIILGASSRGKSLVCQDMAASAAMEANTNVLIYSLEMSENRYAERLFCRFLGCTKKELRANPLEIRKVMKNIRNTTNSRIFIKEFPSKSVTVDQLHANIRSVRMAGFNPSVIFVDYADLLRPSDKRQDKREELGDIFVQLRSVAQMENIPIWTPTQGNRGSYNKNLVDMDDIAEDFSKAMTCDTMISICQSREEKSTGQMRIFIAKNRNGLDKVSFQFAVDYDRMKLSDLGVQV